MSVSAYSTRRWQAAAFGKRDCRMRATNKQVKFSMSLLLSTWQICVIATKRRPWSIKKNKRLPWNIKNKTPRYLRPQLLRRMCPKSNVMLRTELLTGILYLSRKLARVQAQVGQGGASQLQCSCSKLRYQCATTGSIESCVTRHGSQHVCFAC